MCAIKFKPTRPRTPSLRVLRPRRLPRGQGRQGPRAARDPEAAARQAGHGESRPQGGTSRPGMLASAECAAATALAARTEPGIHRLGAICRTTAAGRYAGELGAASLPERRPSTECPLCTEFQAPKPTASHSMLENRSNSSHAHIRGGGGNPQDQLVSAETRDRVRHLLTIKKK